MQGLTGLLGDQLLIRTDKAGRTIVGVKPTYSENREFTEGQIAHHEAFREALRYAKTAKDLDIYKQRAQGTPQNAYNVAVADWFKAPEVKELDLAGWNGKQGRTIRVRATDDVKVQKVQVAIFDANGNILEEGPAQPVDELWWAYTTTQGGSATRLVATAHDLPGHTGEKTWGS
jgi:hypothetical protein